MSTVSRSPSRARRAPLRNSGSYSMPTPISAKARSAGGDRRGAQQAPQTRLRTVPPSTPRSPGTPSSPTAVRRLPSQRSLPLWLRLLIKLQRGSVIITFVLITLALVLYGSTVYTQQLWSREYNKLKTMQRNERQLVSASSMLRNQIAQQAERPASGLIPRTPAHLIFLRPAPSRPAPANTTTTPQPQTTPDAPLGY